MAEGIVANDQVIACEYMGVPINVLGPADHGKRFRASDPNISPRKAPVKWVVVHWTAGERNPLGVFGTLQSRRLGVGLTIGARFDRVGIEYAEIYQFVDDLAELKTAHAGFLNDDLELGGSVGIEVVCYGYLGPWWKPQRWKIPTVAKDRPRYQTELRGKRRTLADFYPHQYGALFATVDALCEAFDTIPRQTSETALTRTADGTMTRAQLGQMNGGVVGHYEISDSKSDPGTRPIRRLTQHFAGW